MILQQPDVVSSPDIQSAVAEVKRKRRTKSLPALDALRLERFNEGRCAQLLHVGPFSEEGPSSRRVPS